MRDQFWMAQFPAAHFAGPVGKIIYAQLISHAFKRAQWWLIVETLQQKLSHMDGVLFLTATVLA